MKPGQRSHQSGAAILVAMLTVTLVASLSAAALWQQWRGTEVESAERARQQSAWILQGALDWARLILREDARSGGVDHLGEPWAVGLEEARLSSFLAARGSTVDDPALELFLSGRMTDLQSRLNVRNLVHDDKIHPPTLNAFAVLFDNLQLPRQELAVLANNLVAALGTSAQAPLMPGKLDQLTWLGLSPQSLERLRPYVTLLPERTPVNINTASALVLHASAAGLSMADAQGMVQMRNRAHFTSVAQALEQLRQKPKGLTDAEHGVGSRFFEAKARLRSGTSALQEQAVLQRDGQTLTVLWRERSAAVASSSGSSLQ
jgi:general secretion pathway protein K